MLLFVLILAICGGAVAAFGGTLRETLQARVLGVQGMIGAAFHGFLLLLRHLSFETTILGTFRDIQAINYALSNQHTLGFASSARAASEWSHLSQTPQMK